jgi:hypothetical protein
LDFSGCLGEKGPTFLGFFTFLVALAHGAPCRKSSLLSKGQLILKCPVGSQKYLFIQY